jgi:endonuclease/exonuclease/phosphatase family metal-dependent hydrolase
MGRLVPLDGGRAWHVHKVRGNVIASKYPLKALPSRNNNYAAACIDLKGKPLVVMSVHLSAMGYIQSKEDLWRIQQAKTILETLEGIATGEYDALIGSHTKPGIVMVGDYNLVGSYTPVALLTSTKTVGLKDWLVPNLVGESVITWRGGLNTGFSPGKLDYMLYSGKTLTPRNGFVLDTSLLNQTELNQLKLKSEDSGMSDHLLSTVDFQLRY